MARRSAAAGKAEQAKAEVKATEAKVHDINERRTPALAEPTRKDDRTWFAKLTAAAKQVAVERVAARVEAGETPSKAWAVVISGIKLRQTSEARKAGIEARAQARRQGGSVEKTAQDIERAAQAIAADRDATTGERPSEAVMRELDERKAKREAKAGTAAVETPTLAGFALGQSVEVYAMGHWYGGLVTAVNRARIDVTYTSGAGTTRVKPVNPTKDTCDTGPDKGKPMVRSVGFEDTGTTSITEARKQTDTVTDPAPPTPPAKPEKAPTKPSAPRKAPASDRAALYAKAIAAKQQAKAAGQKRKGEPVTDDQLAAYIAGVLAKAPEAICAREMEIGSWIEGMAFSPARWRSAWTAASKGTKRSA